MDDSTYYELAEATMRALEHYCEELAAQHDWDLEATRNGNVLEIESLDNDSKMIINTQAAVHEIWLAARAGGYHFRHDGKVWRDTRDQVELIERFTNLATQQFAH